MVPVAGILAAAKGGAVGAGLGAIEDAVGGLFGNSAADRARRAQVKGLADRAATGDVAALRQLEFIAFEPRRGLPGDLRVPPDGRSSPGASRHAARTALKGLVTKGAKLSQESYYAKLAVPKPPSQVQQVLSPILTPVLTGAVEQARPLVQQEIRSSLRDVLPWIVGVGIVLLVAGWFLARRSS